MSPREVGLQSCCLNSNFDAVSVRRRKTEIVDNQTKVALRWSHFLEMQDCGGRGTGWRPDLQLERVLAFPSSQRSVWVRCPSSSNHDLGHHVDAADSLGLPGRIQEFDVRRNIG